MSSPLLNFFNWHWIYSFNLYRSGKHVQTAQLQVSYTITLPMQQKLAKTQPLVFLTTELLLKERIDVRNVDIFVNTHAIQAILSGLFMHVACTYTYPLYYLVPNQLI